jgi:DNA-binding SARP family transcriptional activator
MEVVDAGGRAIGLSSKRERTVLAALATRPGQVVAADGLIEMVWGDAAPATAAHAVQVHVSSLRKLLGGTPSPLVTRAPGYLLQLAPGQLDAERFEQLAARGRAALATGELDRASSSLHEALRLWRGDAYADVEWERFAQPEVRRLDELRLATEEDLIEAELFAGNIENALARLEQYVTAEPLRERRWSLLLLCLYGVDVTRSHRDLRRLDHTT